MKSSKLPIIFVSFIILIIGAIVAVSVFAKDNTPAPTPTASPNSTDFNNLSKDIKVNTSPVAPSITPVAPPAESIPATNPAPAETTVPTTPSN